jgi:DNA repair photolyase
VRDREGSRSSIVGRGAAGNPKNRFERIEVEPDPAEHDAEDPRPETVYLRDFSRSIIARNNSPDIGFDASINPYRGCSHGCVYCLSGDTPILMANGTSKPLEEIQVGEEIYGTVKRGAYRRYTKTRVLAHWSVLKAAYCITLGDGTTLVAGGDHRFLTDRGWKFVTEAVQGNGRRPYLRIGNKLVGTGRFVRSSRDFTRKLNIENELLKSSANLRIASIEPLGVMPLFDITTGTGDFIANGVVSHNCYARPTHEYLGLSAGLDFETKILVKEDAPELLRKELSSPRWEPQVLSMSGVTDPYQPVEKKLRITRRCLEVLAEFRNPVVVVTKNYLVTRDIDLLSDLARHAAAAVAISLTTLDDDLRRVMEPRTSRPTRRLGAIEKLAGAGIPVGVMMAPVIPGLTDHELPALISAAVGAGATFAAYTPVRLPGAVRPIFEDWLASHFPERKDKVLNRIRSIRDGNLNDPRFVSRMRGEGIFADHIAQLFSISCRRAGIESGSFPRLSTAAFRNNGGAQPGLFD